MEIKSASIKKFSVNEYISVGIGRIKTETFDKKGKLTSSNLLVELKKWLNEPNAVVTTSG